MNIFPASWGVQEGTSNLSRLPKPVPTSSSSCSLGDKLANGLKAAGVALSQVTLKGSEHQTCHRRM